MLATLAISALLTTGCPHATRHAAPAREARTVLCLVNAARSADGLRRLRPSAPLGAAARGWARTLVRTRTFSHTGPDGSTPSVRMAHAGYPGPGFGETIAWGQGTLGTPAGIVSEWMDSPPHRAVLLSPLMRDGGVGVVRGSPVAGRPGGTTVVADLGYR
ncbi:MAG TPA: CAP domain-containing protein [Solirubrobacteraceae bacterium]